MTSQDNVTVVSTSSPVADLIDNTKMEIPSESLNHYIDSLRNQKYSVPAEPIAHDEPDNKDDLDPHPVQVDPELLKKVTKSARTMKKQIRNRKMREAVSTAVQKFKNGFWKTTDFVKKFGPPVAAVAATVGGVAVSELAFGYYGAIASAALGTVASYKLMPKLERDSLPEFVQEICDAISKAMNIALDHRVLKLCVSVLLIAYVAFSGKFNLVEKLAACALGTWLSRELITDIFECLITLAQGLSLAKGFSNVVTNALFFPQGDGQKRITALSGVYNSVIKMVCSVFGLPAADRITKEENEDVTRLRNQFGLVKDAHSFMKWTASLLHNCFDRVHIYFFGVPSKTVDNEALIDLTNAYCEKVEDFVHLRSQSKLMVSVEVFDELKDLIKEGDQINDVIVKNKLSLSQFPRLRNCIVLLREADALVSAYSRYDYGRPEPIYVHIDGPTCTGKSTLAQLLFADISHYKLKEPFRAMEVYCKRFSKEQFWEGYNNQPFVLFEEIFQDNSEEMRSQIGIFLLHLINVHIMPLDMAFSGKGKTFFDSRLIISTSNGDERNMPSFSGMQDKEAYFRRIDFWVRVKDKKDANSTSLSGRYKMDLIKTTRQDNQCVHEVYKKDLDYLELLHLILKRWDEKEKSATKNVIHTLARETTAMKLTRLYDVDPDLAKILEMNITIKDSMFSAQILDFVRDVKNNVLKNNEAKNGFLERLNNQVKEFKEKGMYDLLAAPPNESELLEQEPVKMESVEKATSKLYNIYMKLNSQFKSIFSKLKEKKYRLASIAVAGFGVAVTSVYFLYKHFNSVSRAFEAVFPQSYDAAKQMRQNLPKTERKKFDVSNFKPVARTVAPQGTQINPDIIKMIEGNLVTLSTTTTANLCNGLFVTKDTLVTTAHSFEQVLKGLKKTPILLSNHNMLRKDFWITLEEIDFVVVDDLDLLFMKIKHKQLPHFPSIIHHFVDDVTTEKYGSGIAVLSKRTGSIVTITALRADQIGEYTYGDTHIPTGYTAKMATFNGDCAAPWISLDTRDVKKIFGIHVAGNGQAALCTVITSSVIRDALSQFTNTSPTEANPQGIDGIEVGGMSLFEFLNIYGGDESSLKGVNREIYDYIRDKRKIVGFVADDMKVNLPTKTMLHPSPAFESIYPNVMEPAKLRPNPKTGYSPLLSALQKSLKVKGDISPETADVFREFCRLIVSEYKAPDVKYRCLTLQEALNPQRICPHLGQINLKTSLGYPFNLFDRGAGKGAYISETPLYSRGSVIGLWQELTPRFRDYYAESWEKMDTKDPPVIVFQANLKDELRPLAKSDKPRLIFPEPIDFQIHQRRLYGMFIDQVIEKCNEKTIKLGINPLGLDWTRLYTYLHKDKEGDLTDRILQGDISANDWMQTYTTMKIVYETIDELFEDEPIRRLNAREAVLNTKVIFLNFIVEAIINPSGQLLTTIENSINIPSSILTCVYFILKAKGYNYTIKEIYQKMQPSAFGDDTVISYLFKKIPVVFSEVADEMLSRFGLTYTDPKKDGSINDQTSINDLHFLCRELKKDGTLWKAPLRVESITSQVNWFTDSNKYMTWEDHFLISINNALREWYQYGFERFTLERKKILDSEYVLSHLREDQIIDYETCDSQWRDRLAEPRPPPEMEVPTSEAPFDLVNLLPQGCDAKVDPTAHRCPRMTEVAELESQQEEAEQQAPNTPVADEEEEIIEGNLIGFYFTDGQLRPFDHHLDVGMYDDDVFSIEVHSCIVFVQSPRINNGANLGYSVIVLKFRKTSNVYEFNEDLILEYVNAIREQYHAPVVFMRYEDAILIPRAYLNDRIAVLDPSVVVSSPGIDMSGPDEPVNQQTKDYIDSVGCWTKQMIIDRIIDNEELLQTVFRLRNLDDDPVDLEREVLVPQGLETDEPPIGDVGPVETPEAVLEQMRQERREMERRYANLLRNMRETRLQRLKREYGLFYTVGKHLLLFLLGYYVMLLLKYLQERYRDQPMTPQGLEDLKQEEVSDTNKAVTQLTAFTDEANKNPPSVVRMKSSLYQREDPYPDQEMKAVLSRAYTVNYAWTSSMTQGSTFANFEFPSDLIGLSTNLAEKLNRFVYFRAAVKIQIRVNGTPFHYGKLLATWIPNYTATGSGAYELTNLYRASCNNTQILSANTSNIIEIVIPYVAPAKYMLLEEIDVYPWYFGTLQVDVLHPLLSSSSLTVPPVNVAFTISFVDPEVAGLTSSSFSLESIARRKKHVKDSNSLKPQGNEQVEATEKGFLSGTLATVSKISSLMTTLPVVGGIASMVSPLTKTASSLAKSFGYDKPTTLSPPEPKLNIFQASLTKGVGVDNSDIIALDPKNAVSTESGYFCDDKDYTQILNYARLPGMISVDTYTSLTNGQVLKYIPVAPGFAHYTTGTGPTYTYDTTPLQAVSSLFRYWTGGLKYAIKISTSSFISWRLRITYIPNHNYSTVPDPGTGDYISRTVDINGDITITFTVPYLALTEYSRYVPAHVLVDGTAGPATLPITSGGMLILSVVNAPTYTASTVTPTIYSSMWVAAAEDFRVACPVEPDDNLSTVDLGPFKDVFLPQGILEDSEVPRKLFSHTFDSLAGNASAIIRSGVVMGEEVASLLTLGHRYTANITWSAVTLTNGAEPNFKLTDNMTPARGILDTKTFLRQLYLFSRGSVRYKIWTDQSGVRFQSSIKDYTPIQYGSLINGSSAYSNSGVHLTNAILFTLGEVQVPYYSQFGLVNNKYYVAREYTQNQVLRTFFNSSTNFTLFTYEAFGDDYSLGWPKTPLPIIYTFTTDKEKTIVSAYNSNKQTVAISRIK